MKEQEIFKLKEQIDKYKSKLSEKKGRREGLLEDIKNKWNCASLDELNEKIEEMENQKEDVQSKIDEGIEELENNYEL
jgi:HD-GYP domain-containing protein (c-di-GMP phosphodiesterase class II)